MKLIRCILFILVFAWFMFLCVILLNSCATTKIDNPVVIKKQKTFYKITPVDKDGRKGSSIITK